MIVFPADMLAAAESIPPAEEWLLACIKMPSGDVWLSDRPASPELRALLPAEPLAAVEDWGVLDDGGTVDGLLSTGSVGNLECPTVKITVLRADQTKTQIDAIINQGIHNRRVELYRWFSGMTSAPVLIDTLFIQDKIELTESSMLWSFEAVGCLAAENPRMSELDDKGRNWPYVIGKAQGVPITLLESESSKWTELLGDENGEPVSETYTGPIRVRDSYKLRSGTHLINGEYVLLGNWSAGYKKLISRGVNGSEPQTHSNGSRIFPNNAHFYYAVCAGPIGGFEKLRSSNDPDTYDEDGDGNTTEYLGLYEADNVHYLPASNPAQIRFDDRMPYLMSNQELDITDKVFYGDALGYGYSSAILCENVSEINIKNGKAGIKIPYREFSKATGTETGYTEPLDILCPSASEGHLVFHSPNLKNGKFSASQAHGLVNSSQSYTEFRVNGTAEVNDIAYMLAPFPLNTNSEYRKYDDRYIIGIVVNNAYYNKMRVRFDFYFVKSNMLETPILTLISPNIFGNTIGSGSVPGLSITWEEVSFYCTHANIVNARLKMKMTMLEKADNNSYAYIRIGGYEVGIGDFASKVYYGMWGYQSFKVSSPSAYITSTFNRNLSSRGTFISAKVRVAGKTFSTAGKATGTVKIFEDSTEKYSAAISESGDFNQTVDITAASWLDLVFKTIKIQVDLTSLSGEITEGSAGITLTDGVQWLLTYKSTTLDGLQVNYADALYVDAVSTRGPDWTPARALQWISEDKTTWAADMLDTDALDDRHTEYAAAGHALNGLRAEERYQDVIREVLRQGFSRPVQSGGKLSIVNHLTDAAALPVMTAGLDDLFSKSKTFTTTDTPQLVQKIIVNYNKSLSTGEWDGKYELATGEAVQELSQIDLDMINSTTAVQLAAAWLYALKTVQLQVFGYAGNFRMISAQKADKIILPSFLFNNALCEMLAVNVKQDFGKGKTGKMTKFLIQAIRKV